MYSDDLNYAEKQAGTKQEDIPRTSRHHKQREKHLYFHQEPTAGGGDETIIAIAGCDNTKILSVFTPD